MDTKQAILNTALELFNRDGVAEVSTNHIAKALKISPGNLYYHYRNREEIVRALCEQFFAAWEQALQAGAARSPSLDSLQELARANFRVLWDYRFVYREFVVLLRHDEALLQRWLEVRDRGLKRFRELFDAYVEAGVLSGVAGTPAVEELAEICAALGGFWLASFEASGREVDEAAIAQGVNLLLRVLRARRFRVAAD
jgi:AcrR family transcriptional regulator